MTRLVLVAEDEVVSQKLASVVITQAGYTPYIVQNGQQCLDALRTGLKPDLLLLDLEMPFKSGIEVLTSLKENGETDICPIVIFTSHHSQDTVKDAVRLGAADFVIKPYLPHELAQRISDLIFEINEDQLRKLLEKLHFQDHTLGDQPSLRTQVTSAQDLFPVSLDNKSICVALPHNMLPRHLAKATPAEILLNTQIFRKTNFGWRKVWPRYHDYDIFSPPKALKNS